MNSRARYVVKYDELAMANIAVLKTQLKKVMRYFSRILVYKE